MSLLVVLDIGPWLGLTKLLVAFFHGVTSVVTSGIIVIFCVANCIVMVVVVSSVDSAGVAGCPITICMIIIIYVHRCRWCMLKRELARSPTT